MRLFVSVFSTVALTSTAAFAGGGTTVPEIGAVGGLAAVGAVGAVVAYLWERRRKR